MSVVWPGVYIIMIVCMKKTFVDWRVEVLQTARGCHVLHCIFTSHSTSQDAKPSFLETHKLNTCFNHVWITKNSDHSKKSASRFDFSSVNNLISRYLIFVASKCQTMRIRYNFGFFARCQRKTQSCTLCIHSQLVTIGLFAFAIDLSFLKAPQTHKSTQQSILTSINVLVTCFLFVASHKFPSLCSRRSPSFYSPLRSCVSVRLDVRESKHFFDINKI